MKSVLPVNWILIAVALIVPLLIAVPAARFFWRRRQLDVGNVVGSGMIFLIAIFCFGDEFVRVLRATTACEAARVPCVMFPSPLVRFTIFGVIAFVQVAALYWIGLVVEERHSQRSAFIGSTRDALSDGK